MGEKYGKGELSDADKSYYIMVAVPAASKSVGVGVGFVVLDLTKL